MIQILKLIANDAFSYKGIEFDFKQGLHNLQGLNGSAKTSLFMCLCQVFFNRNPKGCKVGEVDNIITGKPYEITVEFTKGSDSYTVINSRKNGIITILKNGRDISLKRIPDNLKLIEDILGCNYAMFSDLIYQSKESTLNLIETSTDKGRKEFIARILRLDEIDELLVKVKDAGKDIEGKTGKIPFLLKSIETLKSSLQDELTVGEYYDLAPLQKRLQELNSEAENYTEVVNNLRNELKEAERLKSEFDKQEKVREAISNLETELSEIGDIDSSETLQKRIGELNTEIAVSSTVISQLKSEIQKAKETQGQMELLAKYHKELADIELPTQPEVKLREVLTEYNNKQTQNNSTIKSIRKEYLALKDASEQTGTCPTCGHSINKDQFKGRLQELKIEGNSLVDENVVLEEQIGQILYNLDKWEKVNKLSVQIDKLSLLTPVEVDLEDKEKDLQLKQELLAQCEVAVKGLTPILAKAKRAEQINLELASLMGQVSDIKFDYDDYKMIEANLAAQLAGFQGVKQDLADAQADLEKAKIHNSKQDSIKEVNERVRETNLSIQASIQEKEAELNSELEKLELLKTWQGILGNKGYRMARVAKFLKSLNTTMAKYSKMISGGRIQCRSQMNQRKCPLSFGQVERSQG
jgi:DNA repair exonuclease SbcCD ATPase subunit